MRKIFIIGIVASGKTTLAKRLSNQLSIPWHELDNIVHHHTLEGRNKRTPEEQVEVIYDIDRSGDWIFEGVHRESYNCLLDMADTIIFLDPPLWKRKIRILTRYIKQNLGLERCDYKPDIAMLKMMYTWTSNFEHNRPAFEAKLNLYRHKVTRVTNSEALDKVLRNERVLEDSEGVIHG
ncbi:hypothetical protein ASD24_13630 [Paenibacillus sp. Root52]|uniref:hypothetical protein n=1 Tax=Paenibacillus sp. Root52 TaxID=1736552 RepID=UPI0006FD16F6|nr:hypothetical protein [Paenibacillus sp. Root52]KQY83313.1 hypothetical protein ASD24_13630 [Paenibacillus sp. Root52]